MPRIWVFQITDIFYSNNGEHLPHINWIKLITSKHSTVTIPRTPVYGLKIGLKLLLTDENPLTELALWTSWEFLKQETRMNTHRTQVMWRDWNRLRSGKGVGKFGQSIRSYSEYPIFRRDSVFITKLLTVYEIDLMAITERVSIPSVAVAATQRVAYAMLGATLYRFLFN